MIEVTAHGVIGQGGFVALDATSGGFALEVSPRWNITGKPMVAHVTMFRSDCDQLEGIYRRGTSAMVVGLLIGEEADGKTRIRIHAAELMKSDATDSEGRVRHQFMRGHVVGRIKRPPAYEGHFCNFDLLSWSEGGMTLFGCKISGSIEVANFRSRYRGEGTRVSLTGNVREHRFTDRSGTARNRLVLDVDEWEVLR